MHGTTGGVSSGRAAVSASSHIEQLAEILGRVSESFVPARRDGERGAAPADPSVFTPGSRQRTVSASIQAL